MLNVNYSGETHRLLAIEATEFMLDCLNNGMNLRDICDMYIQRKGPIQMSYGGVLQQLIREHVDCYLRLANGKKVQGTQD